MIFKKGHYKSRLDENKNGVDDFYNWLKVFCIMTQTQIALNHVKLITIQPIDKSLPKGEYNKQLKNKANAIGDILNGMIKIPEQINIGIDKMRGKK